MNDLPFDALCQVFEFLPVRELAAMSTFQGRFDDAAQSVARRRHSTYTLSLDTQSYATSFSVHCIFVSKFVRKLTINYYPFANVNKARLWSITDLVDAAHLLVDLTLDHPVKWFDFGAHWLGRIERLTLHNICDCDHWVAAVLSTCGPNRLKYLHIDRLCLTGRCLLAMAHPRRALNMCRGMKIDAFYIRGLFGRPRLHGLDICDSNGKRTHTLKPMVQRFIIVERLIHELRIESDDCAAMIEKLARLVRPNHPLRDLTGQRKNDSYVGRMGIDFMRLKRLETLQLDMYSDRVGLDSLLVSITGHPALQNIALGGCEQQLITPGTVVRCLPDIRRLHVRATLSLNLETLATMSKLRVLKLRLNVPRAMDREVQISETNQFLRTIAAQNQLEYLHMQWNLVGATNSRMIIDSMTLELDPCTITALRRFTSLRELRLVARAEIDTIASIVKAMKNLQVFEWTGGAKELLTRSAVEGLRSLRPNMRVMRIVATENQI